MRGSWDGSGATLQLSLENEAFRLANQAVFSAEASVLHLHAPALCIRALRILSQAA